MEYARGQSSPAVLEIANQGQKMFQKGQIFRLLDSLGCEREVLLNVKKNLAAGAVKPLRQNCGSDPPPSSSPPFHPHQRASNTGNQL
jgi:hypothetical protein